MCWCLVLSQVKWPARFRIIYKGLVSSSQTRSLWWNVCSVTKTTHLWCPNRKHLTTCSHSNRNHVCVLTRREIHTHFQTWMAPSMTHFYTETVYNYTTWYNTQLVGRGTETSSDLKTTSLCTILQTMSNVTVAQLWNEKLLLLVTCCRRGHFLSSK